MTVRELFWLFDGKKREAWNAVSQVLAALHNPHRDTDEFPDPLPPSEFHPMPDRMRWAEEQARQKAREESRLHRVRLRDLKESKHAIMKALQV